jgi:hypothetical protein
MRPARQQSAINSFDDLGEAVNAASGHHALADAFERGAVISNATTGGG